MEPGLLSSKAKVCRVIEPLHLIYPYTNNQEKQPARPYSLASASHAPMRSQKRQYSPSPSTGRKGRSAGAQGYQAPDLSMLMRIVKGIQPIGPDEWTKAADTFNAWARGVGRPERGVKALRSKFDAVC